MAVLISWGRAIGASWFVDFNRACGEFREALIRLAFGLHHGQMMGGRFWHRYICNTKRASALASADALLVSHIGVFTELLSCKKNIDVKYE